MLQNNELNFNKKIWKHFTNFNNNFSQKNLPKVKNVK